MLRPRRSPASISAIAADLVIRTSLTENLDYLFPLMLSTRAVQTDSFSLVTDAGVSGMGYSSPGGLLTAVSLQMHGQYRFGEHFGLTLSPWVSASRLWGSQESAWSAGTSLSTGWTAGDWVQGGIGAAASLSQDKFSLFLDSQSLESQQGTENAVLSFGSVGTVSGAPTPLLQVRIWKGLHLYEASSVSLNAESLDVQSHQHVVGVNWYWNE